MNILVTGNAGFIGSHIADALIKDGHVVVGIDNLSTGKKENINPQVKFQLGDISLYDLDQLLVGIDAVIHVAARPRISYAAQYPLESHYANVVGTIRLLEASARAKIKRFVYFSSSSVYGKYEGKATEWKTKLQPVNLYGFQKFEAEKYVQTYDLNSVILRPFNVYGPRMTSDAYGTVIGKFMEQKKQNQPLTIVGSGFQRRDFTFVGDVVRAVQAALMSDYQGAINIGSGRPVSIRDIAKMIGGTTTKIDGDPGVAQTWAENSRAKEVLGWTPEISIEQGLHITQDSQT